MTISGNFRYAKIVGSSLSIVLAPPEGKDSVSVSSEKESVLGIMPGGTSSSVENNGSDACFAPPSTQFSSCMASMSGLPQRIEPGSSLSVSRVLDGLSFPPPSGVQISISPNNCSPSLTPACAFLNYPGEQEDVSSYVDPHQGCFGFSELAVENLPVDSGTQFIPAGHNFSTSDLQEMPEHLICVDDALERNWAQLLADINTQNPGPEILSQIPDFMGLQEEVHESPVVPSEEQALTMILPCSTNTVANPTCPAASTKSRMRWTQELHEKFVEAVNELGERATPKCVLMKMGVPGLTICNVKSHLQKYRTARYSHRPDSSEGSSPKKSRSIDDLTSAGLEKLTEALRLQMELQKILHEQLENQRKLQLQMEEQGKRLQMMIQKQQKMQEDASMAPSSSNHLQPQRSEGTDWNNVNEDEDSSKKRRKYKDEDRSNNEFSHPCKKKA